jgi:hypothetical protein
MEKEFITYEQALELKGLGFNEPCFGWFRSTLIPSNFTEYFLETEFGMNESPSDWVNSNFLDKACSAPLYQQAFRWFREKYNLRGFIGFRPNVKQFDCHIYDMSLSGKEYVKQRTMEEFNKDPKVGTYEEAELECLKKLIEIVKKQKEDESNIIV